jgi:hypothetical protein
VAVMGERLVAGWEWQEIFRPRRLDIDWIWKVFGSVIGFGLN